jgi:putative transposase
VSSLGGIASRANGLWMTQIARNPTDEVDGFFKGKRYLIHDCDSLYIREFLKMLEGTRSRLGEVAARSPKSERLFRQVRSNDKRKLSGATDLVGEDALRTAVFEFLAHYHGERNHQGLGNRLIMPSTATVETNGSVQRKQRLGGLLNYYHRAAA